MRHDLILIFFIATMFFPLGVGLGMMMAGTPSRHKWYTPSGLFSRGLSFLAVKFTENPNEIGLAAVFAYGMVELFGVIRTVKIMAKFRKLQLVKSRRTNGGRTRNEEEKKENHPLSRV